MILKKEHLYPLSFDIIEDGEYKPSKEDVFVFYNGNKIKQFYKGQLLPIDIWNDIFSKQEDKGVSFVLNISSKPLKEEKENNTDISDIKNPSSLLEYDESSKDESKEEIQIKPKRKGGRKKLN